MFLAHPKLPKSTLIYMCPTAYMTARSLNYFEQYYVIKKMGAMPYDVGLFQHPAILVQAFMIVQSAVDKKESIDADEMKRKAGKHGGNNNQNIHSQLPSSQRRRQGHAGHPKRVRPRTR